MPAVRVFLKKPISYLSKEIQGLKKSKRTPNDWTERARLGSNRACVDSYSMYEITFCRALESCYLCYNYF